MNAPKCQLAPLLNPMYCPLLLYILLVLLGLIGILMYYNHLVITKPPTPPPQPPQPPQPPLSLTILGPEFNRLLLVITAYIIVSYIIGVIIYGFCSQCQYTKSWVVFLLAIITPILVAMAIGLSLKSILS